MLVPLLGLPAYMGSTIMNLGALHGEKALGMAVLQMESCSI